MRKLLIFATVSVVLPVANCFGLDIVKTEIQQQYDSVRPGSDSALAIHFKMSQDWHFYADEKTAPNNMVLSVSVSEIVTTVSFIL